MRKALFAFVLLFANVFCFVQSANAGSLTAGNIFQSMGGTVTIDQGGAIHSQARSIYSLGGGMATFQGKKVSLIAADPPGFSAGCSGISWHFGGFSFISMDEIRQLVEAVAQASLGVAVDLAMQTLCPQCYAVMSKLRDIANAMRNAAADACKVAQNFGALLAKEGGLTPGSSTSKCAETSAEKNKTSGWLEAASSGGVCGLLSKAETEVSSLMADVNKWTNGLPTSDGKTPDKQTVAKNANLTYEALKNLGYKDGVSMDFMLSYLGMTITLASATDCKSVLANLKGTAKVDEAADPATAAAIGADTPVKKEVVSSSTTTGADTSGAQQAAINPADTGAKQGPQVCYVPPHITGFDEVGAALICGFKPLQDATRFAGKFHLQGGISGEAAVQKLGGTSLGELCKVKQLSANSQSLGANVPAISNMKVLSCSGMGACLAPKQVTIAELVGENMTGEYTGVAWMILDSLYAGVETIMKGQEALPPATVKVLSSSGYPLYRLLNMAAVYPGMADEMLQAYGGIIAVQYVMDTLDRVSRIGSQPTMYAVATNVSPGEMGRLREEISQMTIRVDAIKSQVQRRMNEKRALVQSIVEVNRALQAEVISRGLGDNNNMAISLKKQQAGR